MIVSTKGRYAVRIMLALAGNEDYSSLKQIVNGEAIPHKYAENIMTCLVKRGLVRGSRGKSGGYMLALPPEKITAFDILSVTETALSAVSCTVATVNPCPRAGSCPTLPLWKELDDAVKEVLLRYSLYDLLQMQRQRD